MRVVSLLPSLTEIVCALSGPEVLVGRSHECDFPGGLEGLPALTTPKFEVAGSSRQIDDRVQELVQQGLSVYAVDAETLRQLEPDLVLTQDQCEVCAASLGDVEAALEAWTGREPKVISTSPGGLAEVWSQIPQIASALGVPERGSALLAELTDRVTAIGERSGALQPRPRVACIEWVEPLMSAGNWVPELVALAGGENLFGAAGAHSPRLEWDSVVEADPDILVLMPCGYDLDRTQEEVPLLEARPGWSELRAVRNGRVIVTDGNQYFNRPGPRLADSLEMLAGIFHPDSFPEFRDHPGFRHLS